MDATGIPLVAILTGAQRHDVTQLLPLLDQVPPVAGKIGRPKRRFAIVQGDRAYHSQPHRREIRRRGGKPLLARRNAAHGSGLGKSRWPVERTLGWMHQPRRLRVRYEKRGDMHEALMIIREALICWQALHR